MLGSFIIGIPAMTFREFQNNYPGFKPEPAILRSISPEERRKIGLHLWAKMKPDTMFIVRVSGPCPEDIPEEPTFGGEGEKKFWIFSKTGKEGGVKVFLEVGPTPVLQEPPTSDPQKLRRRLPHMVNKESGWPEPGNNHLKPPASWTF
jgi:hypothetical protein